MLAVLVVAVEWDERSGSECSVMWPRISNTWRGYHDVAGQCDRLDERSESTDDE